MSWIKRNLYFLIGSVVALALMGLAGWFLFSKYQLYNEVKEKLNADYAELDRLNKQTPHPGSGAVDNIKTAKEQQQQLRATMENARKHFQRIAPIPEVAKLTDQDFFAALSRTIYQLQREATNASVVLLPNYNFSFEAQTRKLSFAAGSLDRLAVQLGEVKTICDVLFQAKINYLDNLRRERLSADDAAGPQTDYLTEKSTTNDLAVVTPYEVTFRCFSAELASVLSGFAVSPHGLIVKTINVDIAPVTAPDPSSFAYTPGTYTPQPVAAPTRPMNVGGEAAAFASRYGLR
ncbi:MAG TPA: Amuc_1100 family pilus-like protein, partial [Candidatus Sulfotelmatobacter sp.]|nr:Amuc_1100 family pilus-like protein [Candidatus Sulfotelmatobacter sp.]